MNATGEQPTYLIAGATGVIGRRLAMALRGDGVTVRALVRDRGRGRRILGPEVELFEADLTSDPDLSAAMEGVEVAYFLVHMLGSGRDYAERERAAAELFARAATSAGVGRVIYLGGLGPDEGGSPHLDSRHHTAEALRRWGPPLTYFRASIVIGSGSESLRTIAYLVRRLPAMVTPSWTSTRTQPIAAADVVEYLAAALEVPGSSGREIEIGGREVTTYGGLLDLCARAQGRRPRPRIGVPLLSPGLSSHWIGLVTPVDAGVARPLVEGLTTETVVVDPSGMELFDVEPTPLEEAMQAAVDELF
ncbi:MAG: NAD(P)H-binding protein [Solirubrobacterales bacterium]|nr:NAD(P)H-binding protein [Solirubrobacterales bacterium]